MEDNQISITDPADTGGSKREPKAFSYDFAYDWTSSQEGVHLDLGAPIVEKALQGYNGKSSDEAEDWWLDVLLRRCPTKANIS